MNRNDRTAEQIGRRLDKGLGDPSWDEAGIQECAQAVYLAMASTPRSRARRWVPYAAAAAVLFALGVGWTGYRWFKTGPIGYRVGDGLAHTTNTGWVQNTASMDLPIRFDNGSLFLLGRLGEAKVVESDRHRVRIDLRRGTVAAKVKGDGRTEWVVEAGPYRVKVLGTEFKVTWQEDARFSVSVTSGRVSVEGEGVREGVVLAAGQTLLSSGQHVQIVKTVDTSRLIASASGQSSATAASPPLLQTDELPSLSPSPPETDTRENPPLKSPKTPGTGASRTSVLPAVDSDDEEVETWRLAIREEAWAKAVRRMSDEDFRSVENTGTLNDLWHLADAARRARRIDAAEGLFVAIRNRFQGTDRASVSAFLLGKTALDTGGKPKDAVRWLRTYLEEAPDGELAEEALGRLMEAYRALGRPTDASTCARDYLSLFPKGTYSGEAAALAGE